MSKIGRGLIMYMLRNKKVYYNDSFGDRVGLPTHRSPLFKELTYYQFNEWINQSKKHNKFLNEDFRYAIAEMTIPEARVLHKKLGEALDSYTKHKLVGWNF